MWYRIVTPILLASIGLVVLMLVVSSMIPLLVLAILIWLLSLLYSKHRRLLANS